MNMILCSFAPYYYYFPRKTYRHFPREVWLHNIGFGTWSYVDERVYDGSGEDPTCSRVSGNPTVSCTTLGSVDVSDHSVGAGRRVGGHREHCRLNLLERQLRYCRFFYASIFISC